MQVLDRNPETGEVRLRLKPLNANRVRMEEGGAATPYSTELAEGNYEITTKSLSLSFLGEHTVEAHEPGQAVSWTNTIDVKHRAFEVGEGRKCELKAIPTGAIRYTIDGSSPKTSGQSYTEPFAIPNDPVLVLAYAAADGVESNVERFQIPKRDSNEIVIDPHRPARWERKFRQDSTGDTFEFLTVLARHRASLAGLRIDGEKDGKYWEVVTDPAPASAMTVANVRLVVDLLHNLYPGRNITLEAAALELETGLDLRDLVAELKTRLKPNEVKQLQ